MKALIVSAAAVLGLLPSAGLAQQAKASASQPVSTTTISGAALSAKDSNEEKVICRTYEDTGTRLGTNRRCMTLKEWRHRDGEFAAETSRKLNSMIGLGNAH